jgi:hypothetical protein
MGRVSLESLKEELKRKGLRLADNSPKYENLNTQIAVYCKNDHRIVTTLKSIRHVGFVCPICVGEKTKGFTEPPYELPRKKGYRIIGIDNATHNMGISLFEDGKLIYYKLFTYKGGSHIHRLNEIKDTFEETIVPI